MNEKVYSYLVENTGIIAEITPFFAVYETFGLDMNTAVSQHARLFGGGIIYLGLGSLFQKGRENSENYFHIGERSSWARPVHDVVYNAAFTAVVSPLTYLVAGETDMHKIFWGTVGGAVLGTINGAPVGYAIDVFQDLGGIKNCERPSYPTFLRETSPSVKKAFALGLLLASAALTWGIYAFHEHASLEHLVEQH